MSQFERNNRLFSAATALLAGLGLASVASPRLAGAAAAAGALYMLGAAARSLNLGESGARGSAPGTASSASRPRRALIIGSGTLANILAQNLEESDRYRVIGFVDDAPISGGGGWLVLGTLSDLERLVGELQIDEVLLALPPSEPEQRVARLIQTNPGLQISVVPSACDALMRLPHVESFGDIAVARLGSADVTWVRVKRYLDAAAAVIALFCLAPLLLLAALGVRLTTGGPAIFKQARVGKDGRHFTLFKFRSMVLNAEAQSGPVLASGKDDPRLTPFGKFLRRSRLDELPQLWNVVRGDMALIGPRPERPHFVAQFAQSQPLYNERHRVRPGITGLAQVRAGYHTDARDKLRYDLMYVSSPSLMLDLEIAIRTLGVMLKLCG